MRALRLIGAIGTGETPTAVEFADALEAANDMLDSWLAERLMAFSIAIQEFPLVGGQQTYTYGPGGNFNALRPAKIERVSIVSLNNPAQPLELPIPYFTDWDWQNVPVKLIGSALPMGVYDDGNYPLRNLSFWTFPTTVSNFRAYVWQQLTEFSDLTTDVQFPPAYRKAIVYNLALELGPEWGFPPSQSVIALALDSKAIVKSINLPVIQSFGDPALCGDGGHYNYFSDTIVGGGNR